MSLNTPSATPPTPAHPQFSAIVVAAGGGERLGAGRPKAMMEVGGRALFQWAAAALRDAGCERLVIVAPPEGNWRNKMAVAEPTAMLVAGGDTRQKSVLAGLRALEAVPTAFVLVHDAARALTPPSVVERVLQALADGHTCVVPAVPTADTMRLIGDDGTSTLLDRSLLRCVQTPQGFKYGTLLRAHKQAAENGIEATDDASLCELAGEPVWLVEGDQRAFKITTPFDLSVAQGLDRS